MYHWDRIRRLEFLGRKASKLVDLSASNYGYDGKRFHGAFTGGFNAGYYNSVGSVEGTESFCLRNDRLFPIDRMATW